MAQQPKELDPSLSPRHDLGARIRQWRTERGLSQAQLARLVRQSAPLISKVEKAERCANPDLIHALDTVLDTGGALRRFWETAIAPPARHYTASTATNWTDIARGAAEWWSTSDAGASHQKPVPPIDWSHATTAVPTLTHRGSRRIGQTDIDSLWTMCRSFAATDHLVGGGFGAAALGQLLKSSAPLLRDADCDNETGRQLARVTARLTDLYGFLNFDVDNRDAAQHSYIHAWALARASGDQALTGHVLSDLAMFYTHIGHPRDALEAATAGAQVGRLASSPATVTRCLAMQARAHARAGERRKAHLAMAQAERELDRIHPHNEPEWVRFFDHAQLATECTYAHHDLQDPAARNGQWLIDTVGTMRRRHVLVAATLAANHTQDRRGGDIEAACALLTGTAHQLSSLTSKRALDAVNSVRRQLTTMHKHHSAVEQMEQAFTAAWARTTP